MLDILDPEPRPYPATNHNHGHNQVADGVEQDVEIVNVRYHPVPEVIAEGFDIDVGHHEGSQ